MICFFFFLRFLVEYFKTCLRLFKIEGQQAKKNNLFYVNDKTLL